METCRFRRARIVYVVTEIPFLSYLYILHFLTFTLFTFDQHPKYVRPPIFFSILTRTKYFLPFASFFTLAPFFLGGFHLMIKPGLLHAQRRLLRALRGPEGAPIASLSMKTPPSAASLITVPQDRAKRPAELL